MSPNWDENRISAVLRTTTQIVLSKTLTISIGSLRFSRRRVTYPRPSGRKSLQYNELQHEKWRRRELHPRPRFHTIL